MSLDNISSFIYFFADRNDSPIKVGNTINRKKNTYQINERPQSTENRFTPDDEIAEKDNYELNYNNIYKKLQATKHANLKAGNKIIDEQNDQHLIKSRFPSFSSSYSHVDTYTNNGVDENQGNQLKLGNALLVWY